MLQIILFTRFEDWSNVERCSPRCFAAICVQRTWAKHHPIGLRLPLSNYKTLYPKLKIFLSARVEWHFTDLRNLMGAYKAYVATIPDSDVFLTFCYLLQYSFNWLFFCTQFTKQNVIYPFRWYPYKFRNFLLFQSMTSKMILCTSAIISEVLTHRDWLLFRSSPKLPQSNLNWLAHLATVQNEGEESRSIFWKSAWISLAFTSDQ